MAGLSRFLHPEASRRMLVEEGEFIVDEVSRHWVTRVVPVLIVVGGMLCFAAMPWLGAGWWVGLLLGLTMGALVVRGFLFEILQQIEDESIEERLREIVEAELANVERGA